MLTGIPFLALVMVLVTNNRDNQSYNNNFCGSNRKKDYYSSIVWWFRHTSSYDSELILGRCPNKMIVYPNSIAM